MKQTPLRNLLCAARVAAVTVVAALALAVPAQAIPAPTDFGFLTKWGSSGSGDGQFSFSSPSGVAVDGAGNVYVGDTFNNRVQKFTSAGDFVTKWGSSGSGDGQFGFPSGVAVDGAGNVYVADAYDRVQKFTSAGDFVTKWGSSGSGDGQFGGPSGVAVDGASNVYVADTFNNRVQKFTSAGAYVSQWGGSGSGDGQFGFPSGVAVDGAGNVYVGDTFNNRVQKFTSSGAYVSQWGGSGSGDGQFGFPGGVAVDGAGNVYVADTLNNRVQKFTSTGAYVSQWGGSGSGDGQFFFDFHHLFLEGLSGLATDCRGNVYVADNGNSRIQKFGDSTLAPPPCLASTPAETAPADATPVLSDLSITPGRFTVEGARAEKSRAAKKATVGYELSEQASVGFTIERRVSGRMVGGDCVKPKRGNRMKARCALSWKPVTSFTRPGVAGSNSFDLSARIGSVTLRRIAVYKLTATATDGADQHSAADETYFKVTGR